MKAVIIQPPYSKNTDLSDEFFEYKLKMLDNCDNTADIIVLPEYSDVPCATTGKEDTFFYHKKYINILLDKCVEIAKRCNCLVFVNALCEINGNYRNTTYAYSRKGELNGRKPWQYRPAGSAIIKDDKTLGYPRVCSHRGFNTIAPENSMPAFGAAIAMGAEEIEFDLWPTTDGEIVSSHDIELERVSDGKGLVPEKSLKEFEKLDFGYKFGEKFKGLRIAKFEDILKKFSCQVIMNIHIKPLSYEEPYPEVHMRKIIDLIRKYYCAKHVYLMLETDFMIKQFKEYCPDIAVCVGHLNARAWEIVERAIEFGCEKVQLLKPYFNQEMVDKAHEHGIICNVFFSDEEEETKKYLEMGMDTILTNNYNLISQLVKR